MIVITLARCSFSLGCPGSGVNHWWCLSRLRPVSGNVGLTRRNSSSTPGASFLFEYRAPYVKADFEPVVEHVSEKVPKSASVLCDSRQIPHLVFQSMGVSSPSQVPDDNRFEGHYNGTYPMRLKEAMTVCLPDEVHADLSLIVGPLVKQQLSNAHGARAATLDLLLSRLMSGEINLSETQNM